jgi:hypothetical protein
VRYNHSHIYRTIANFNEKEEEGEEEDDDKARIKLTIEEDYEMAHTLRTEILPNAVMWYTGEAVDDDEDFEGGIDNFQKIFCFI